jgi:uncharacterized protein (DUF2141 family)
MSGFGTLGTTIGPAMAKSRVQSRLVSVAAILLAGVCVCVACVALRGHRDPAPRGPISTTGPAPAPAPAATAPSGALLTITVKDLRNEKGDLILGIFNQADGFPNVKGKSLYWDVKPAADAGNAGVVTFTTRLPPGRYAAGVLHDENSNGDMDKGIAGIPLEGYGVTNNPKPALRKATYGEATFTLPPEGAEMTISLQYF